MADITDVSDAIVNLIAARLYPNGPDGAGAYVPPVKVYPGWPDPQQLEADLAAVAGVPSFLHVSVWKLEMERDTTRYPDAWLELPLPAETYSAGILGNTITISGAAADPYRVQNVAVGMAGFFQAYVHTAEEDQTAAEIAAALGALIAADIPGTTVLGADITIPQPHRISFARVGVIGEAIREVARSETGFQVTIWANNHEQRTALARRLEPTLAGAMRLALPDGSGARIIRRGSTDMDDAQRQGAYRRDLVYSVEYAITETVEAPEIVAFEAEIKDPTGEVIAEALE